MTLSRSYKVAEKFRSKAASRASTVNKAPQAARSGTPTINNANDNAPPTLKATWIGVMPASPTKVGLRMHKPDGTTAKQG